MKLLKFENILKLHVPLTTCAGGNKLLSFVRHTGGTARCNVPLVSKICSFPLFIIPSYSLSHVAIA